MALILSVLRSAYFVMLPRLKDITQYGDTKPEAL